MPAKVVALRATAERRDDREPTFNPDKRTEAMTRNLTFRGWGLVLAGALALPFAGCDVDVQDPGTLPKADVDVQTTPGEAPDVDVTGPDVDVTAEEKQVTVPDVDVDVQSQEETVTVPDVNVDVPEENENE